MIYSTCCAPCMQTTRKTTTHRRFKFQQVIMANQRSEHAPVSKRDMQARELRRQVQVYCQITYNLLPRILYPSESLWGWFYLTHQARGCFRMIPIAYIASNRPTENIGRVYTAPKLYQVPGILQAGRRVRTRIDRYVQRIPMVIGLHMCAGMGRPGTMIPNKTL